MATTITVTREGSGYVLSDGGLIAKLLGLCIGNVGTPWQLYSPTPNEIPHHLIRLETLIASASLKSGLIDALVHPKVAEELHFKPTVGLPPTSPKGFVTAKIAAEQAAKGKKDKNYSEQYESDMALAGTPVPSLDDLGLLGAHKWRLTNAGIDGVVMILGMTEEDLLSKKGIGQRLVARIKKGLKKHKLRLAAKVGKKS
jgi:hypothetical protein